MQPLTIGKIAKQASVGIETIRFYEREGLIAEPPRRESGYRQYSLETVDRVRFIRQAKDLGFSLREIKDLLALRIAPGTTCGQIKKRTQAKIADIEERIRILERMKRALAKLMLACSGRGSIKDCPILEAMEDNKA